MSGTLHLDELGVSALVDSELPAADRDLALAHLAGCLPCRETVDAERQIKARLLALRAPAVPPELLARLRATALAELAPPDPVAVGLSPEYAELRNTAPPLATWSDVDRRPLNRPRGSRDHANGRRVVGHDGRRPGGRGHRNRRIRRAAAGSVSVLALSLVGAVAAGSPAPAGPPVDPSNGTFVVEHARTSGSNPFTEPAATVVSVAGR